EDFLFRALQVKEDGIAGLGKGTLTLATAEDTALATLRHRGGDGAKVATVDQPIMRTIRIGTRLAPVLGLSHGSDLRSSGGVLHTDRKFGLFSFSKYYQVSTLRSTLPKMNAEVSGLA